jgi:transposase-like protein
MEQSTNRQVRELIVLPAPHRLDQRLDADAVQELVAAYQGGAATSELRQRYGLSQGSVLKLLRGHDVTMRWQGLQESDKVVVADLYRDGATLAQLGTQFGVSPNVVRRALLAAGVSLRPRGGSKPRR